MKTKNKKSIILFAVCFIIIFTVGIAWPATLTGEKMELSESVTNDTNETQIYSSIAPTTTSSNTSYHIGSGNYLRPIINGGVTQSGYEMGLDTCVLRNSNGSSANDNGTLTSIIGHRMQYGHYISNTAASPVTTSVYGLMLDPYYITGTVTNWYDVYIGSGATGGTVTNRYGIFQASSTSKNYFAGNVGIGTWNPGARLDVQGQVIGGFGAMTTSGVLDWNDSSNARAGGGYTLLMGNASNGPSPAAYFHPFNFEYYSKDGSGNMLQLALPYYTNYGNGGDNIWMRSRYSGTWGGWRKVLSEDANGNVGIGTTSPTYKLSVNGTIRAKEVKVDTGWSDYVFDDGYSLPSLAQVELYIKENKHLPDVPSAKEIQDDGLSVAEMMAKQMQKIEELTLYMIEQNNRLDQVVKENQELKAQVAELKNMH